MKEAIITLDNLAIGYDGQPVLSGISLSITRSSFTAILGANGSGKSTLLKTLLGLQPPVGGRMQIGARGVKPVFGYVPQAIQFDPLYPLTGFDVALMGTFGRVGPMKFPSRAEKDFVHECIQAIARALATKPDILVLDEPTAGVDVAATKSLLEFISHIHAERNLTVLLVTHDLPLVRKHAQQIIWLHNGQVLHGTVAELFTRERMAEIFEMELI